MDDGWKEHDGGGMPVAGDVVVQVRFRDGIGDGAEGPAERWERDWERSTLPTGSDIVAYRIVGRYA